MQKARKQTQQKLKQTFGVGLEDFVKEHTLNRLNLIELYHKEMCSRHQAGDIDDITWNDLSMNEIYAQLNHTQSYIGEQVLYHQMHNTDRLAQIHTEFEDQLTLFSNNENLRLRVQEKLTAIGKRQDSYYLAPFLMHSEWWKIHNSILLHALQALLCLFLIGAIITQHGIFLIGLLAICFTNLIVYLRTKNQYEAFLYSLGTLKQMLDFASFLMKETAKYPFSIPSDIAQIINETKPLSKKLIGWYGQKMMTLSGDAAAIFQDYLFGITLLDISKFNHIMKCIDGKQEQLMQLFAYVGEIDMRIAIASYRKSLSGYCIPDLCTTDKISVCGLVHPLIEHPVPNDFTLHRHAILTGTNASGKSTFMKALAINVILAKTIHTCTAQKFCIPDLSVMTSMVLRDDVTTGESYYFREAKRIRQMINMERQGKQTLLIIDEMLKGTNTSERVCASVSILTYLANTSQFVMVATHDTEILDRLNSQYANYYFNSIVKNNDIVFDYQIHEGICGSSNAIALLSLLDYPEEIVKKARQELKEHYANQ